MSLSRVKWVVLAAVAATLFSGQAQAGGRPEASMRDWFGHINGGYAFASGDTGDFLDDDWTIGGGVLYWPSDWPVGIGLDINYLQMDLSSAALRGINDVIQSDPENEGEITGGDVENWQFALNGIWSLGPDTSNGFYLTGGISYNSISGRLTETGLVYYPPICDPWYWWWCYPGGVGPGNIVVGKESRDEFGWNIGLGYSFDGYGSQVFIEARYQQISVGSEDLEYIPLTIGVRF